MPAKDELMKGFELGRWSVLPERGLIRDGDNEKRIEPLVMDVFVLLAGHAGDVVNRDQLVDAVWDGRPVADEVITRCIAVLRRNLEDDAKSPQFIETLPRRGYRIMQPVSLTQSSNVEESAVVPTRRLYLLPLIAGFAAVLVIAFYVLTPPLPPDNPAIVSVAVFQFDCLHDAQNPSEHLCFGFSEEAISSLNQIGSLQVVRIRKTYDADISLGQDGLVTGSVQIIGDQIKIAAQLEYARDGRRHIVWSDTFDADTNSIFATQKEVAYAISRAIDRDYEAQTVGARSLAAEESYALARYLFEKRERQATLDAIENFREAIRLDPTYGPAYLGLAYTYIIWPDYDITVDRETVYDKALEVVGEGIEADSSIREAAGTVYGFVFHKRNNWIAAVEEFEKAIHSETVQSIAHAWYSRALASVGRLEAALEHARYAMDLDPGHPDQAVIISRLAIANFWLNDLESAARYFEMASTMQLESPSHSMAYSMFLIRTGRIDEAVKYAELGIEQNGLDSSWVEPVFAGIQDPDLRQRSIDITMQIATERALPETIELALWAELGEVDRAMRLARTLEQNVGILELELIFVDEFKAFRQHPEFADFTEAIGLTAYWDNAGCTWQDDRVRCAD